MIEGNDFSLKSVAVVDDDPAVRNSLKFSLELEGLSVSAFALGQTLLEFTETNPIHCLIVDHQLQDMSGLELVDRLHEHGNHTPAILLTGYPDRRIQRAASTRGATVVEKPLVCGALMERLRAILD